MENRQFNTESNSNVQEPDPEVTYNSVASAPSTAPPPPVSLPSPAGPSNAPYKVFISHAGEDKVTIAFPLREKLRKRGITAFVDKKDMVAGMEATPAMIHAMQTASVGVFVMSPEFVSRKWPMKELMHFLTRRDERKGAGFEGPLIIPVFYRLSIRELYDEPRLDRNDKDGKNLYEKSRFYERQRNGEPEANIAGIKAVLTRLHDCMGVENVANASNDSRYEMYLKREMILDMLCNKICEAVPESTVESAVSEHASEAEHDMFRAHFDKAYNVSELVFDFDRIDSNGNVCTQEGEILQMLLDNCRGRNKSISVCGIGGVGKTSLLRKIQNLDCVFERFKDGVYYMEVGKDATQEGLKEALISIVLKSGGKQTAKNMRKETDIRNVIEGFVSWFAEKQCMFVIDDVWVTKEMTLEIVHHMCNLHTSGQDSKTLLTTRSIDIATYGTPYCLKPREPLEDESRAILYHYAGLKPEQGKEEDKRAVNEILERCAGLPLFLGVAGKAVKTLSFRRGHTGCMAYHVYAEQLRMNMGEMMTTETASYSGLAARLNISMELVEERKKRFDFELSGSMAEMHRRLSVMKKQMRVPMKMLKHLWEVEHESEAARIAKEFEQVGLAEVAFEEEERGIVEVLRLHDSVYGFTVYETERLKEEGVGHNTVLEGYWNALRTSGMQREWWREDLEDDKYIHRNVCRHLMGAGLEDELFGLLLSPKWLERQVELNGVVTAESDFSVGIAAIQKWKEKASDVEEDEMEEALEMMREAITLSSSYILKNERELWFQVHGRLKRAGEWNKVVREYVRKIESDAQKPGVLCMKELLVGVGGANTRIIHVGSRVWCMVLLKDGERFACGCDNGDIAIVNVHRSEIEVRWRAHDTAVNAIDVGKNGTRIVSGSEDGTAKVWDVQSGECVATFDGHSDEVTFVAITEDGKRVVSGSEDGTVQVWDVESGQRVGPSINVDSMKCLTVFKDGEHFVMGRWNVGEIWNVTTSTKVGASFHGHMDTVECAVLTGDESHLVTGSWDATARLWDVETRQQVGDPFEGHWISCIAMSDDGRRVVSGSVGAKICVWDMETREQVCDPLIGHTYKINGVSFLGESDTIVSCSSDESVRVWSLKRKRKETTTADKHRGRVMDVSFTPDGSVVVSGSLDGTLRVWDAISGQAIEEPLVNENSSGISGVAITPDGRFVVSVSWDERVRLWDLQTRKVVRTFEGHASFVSCVAVTADGERAATGSSDRTVRVWDLKSMDGSHFVLEGHSATVWRVFVSDDGKRIISEDEFDNIFVWDIGTQMVTKRTKKQGARIMSRREVLGMAGETTVHDEAGLSIPLEDNEIAHVEGSEARVLGALETDIHCWDISPDKRTICVGLDDGQVGVLKLHL